MSKVDDKQLLRNPDIEPTSEVIANGLGQAANKAYIKFIDGLKNHDIGLCYRYYNDGSAWLGKGIYEWVGVRGGKKEVTAFWLSIWDGFFKITVFIPGKARADALNLPLGNEVKEMIENAEQMGKLKFFPVVFDLCSDKLFDEIYTLIDFRVALK